MHIFGAMWSLTASIFSSGSEGSFCGERGVGLMSYLFIVGKHVLFFWGACVNSRNSRILASFKQNRQSTSSFGFCNERHQYRCNMVYVLLQIGGMDCLAYLSLIGENCMFKTIEFVIEQPKVISIGYYES